ncbi:MAG: cation transporter [Helicobacteraceae bacterium]|nr:cation transporter [Helicobacteraceae bacterium]
MKTSVLSVEGMSCDHCASSVKKALEALAISAEVDLTGKTVTVRFDERETAIEEIKNAVDEQGFEVVSYT